MHSDGPSAAATWFGLIMYGDPNLTPFPLADLLPKDIMWDALHLTTQGYQIWADAIAPTVEAMVKGEKK